MWECLVGKSVPPAGLTQAEEDSIVAFAGGIRQLGMKAKETTTLQISLLASVRDTHT